jgi:aspartyl-tRNA(Asn)/glutamyl-tRNA(Gln) amidotransferase subunit C
MQIDDIKKLAELARLDMTEGEMADLANKFDPIIAYVEQIKEATDSLSHDTIHVQTNVVREDVVTNQEGEYTGRIIAEFPDKKDGYLKVKQVL